MLFLLLSLACRAPAETTVVAEAGALGPYAVERSAFFAARKTGRWFEVDLHLPSADGAIIPDSPVLVLVQGGAVDRERYHWMAEAFAAEGYAVLTPQYPSDLALFGSNRTHAALKRARKLDEDGDPVLGGALGEVAGVLGHSLGGVTAAKQWLRHEDDFAAVAVIASYAANGDAVEERFDPVLSITGSEDGSALEAEVLTGAERFPEATVAVVEGMTHYDWTDDVSTEDLEKEGTVSLRPVEETRADAMAVMLAYFDGVMLGDEAARARLETGDFSGVAFPNLSGD